MNERIRKLREQSLDAQPRISLERAALLTEFYKSGAAERVSVPAARARAFAYILSKKEICISEGELIVGERGPAPKATPTYPEICTHTLEDFAILNSREKISFAVSEEAKNIQKDTVIPFWQGRSLRDRIFEEVDPAWKSAYEAGVFTEFMEQRAPGHTALDDKIYSRGLRDFKRDIRKSIRNLDFFGDPEAFSKREELNAMAAAADALIRYAERHARKAEELARKEKNPAWKRELLEIARICRRVPAHAPRTFREALQYYWFVHLGVITELNTWDSFNPGRLDQHLYPFYKNDIAGGILDEERARELLQAFWIKFNNQPAPPKVGVTAQESNTYTDFCLINIGGVTGTGENAANELSYIRIRAALDFQHGRHCPGAGAAGKIPVRRPERRIQRVRGSGRIREGELHSDGLFQSGKGHGDYAQQRRRP